MNIQKAETKMAVAQAWGKRLEDMREAAEKDVHRLEGGATALREAANALDQHRSYYQKQLDEGELSVDGCQLAMAVITRCVGGLQNLLDKTTLAMSMKKGELVGYTRSGDLVEKEYYKERTQLESIQQAIESGDGVDIDCRPPVTSAATDIQHRKAVAVAQKNEELKKQLDDKEKVEKATILTPPSFPTGTSSTPLKVKKLVEAPPEEKEEEKKPIEKPVNELVEEKADVDEDDTILTRPANPSGDEEEPTKIIPVRKKKWRKRK